MCGIVGFIGDSDATPILIDGLSKLEYRGYDSAGIALMTEDNTIDIKKSKGALNVLKDILDKGHPKSNLGIGHTRWATHGKPSNENSHPHKSSSGKFVIVHNGIIENYAEIKAELQKAGIVFESQTDTEVIAHLLETFYDGDLMGTVIKTIKKIQGSYALGILCSDYPDRFIAVRNASPLIVGLSDNGNFVASDIPAILSYTRDIYHLEDDEIVVLKKDSVEIFNTDLSPVFKKVEKITWDTSAAEKGGYEHFMLKEIMEQPSAIAETISPRINDSGDIILDGINLTKEQIKSFRKICIVACGSAYHVGVVGKYVLEELTRIPIEVDLASEFRYRNPIIDDKTLVIIISQSGETADTLAALRAAKKKGARILSIVNVVGSSIANESDDVLYTWAGPEISVATTKAYSTQLIIIYLIALYMAQNLETLTDDEIRGYLASIHKLASKIEDFIEDSNEKIKKICESYKDLEHAYFIGRNVDYAVALEGALKLKEISYVHAEAYAAGELKHGPIALIEEGTLVVALAGYSKLFEKTKSNIEEVKARGAKVLAITTEDNTAIENDADEVIYIPKTRGLFIPSLEVIPTQLLSYYTAIEKGCNVDKPRNLAKSVTVE
jgi:glucosamine--fructose-6-phosphate aminotransferase (isomerizing)